MTQHIIVAGDPVDGFTFHGPFDDTDDAYLFAETLDADWVLAPLASQPARMMIVVEDEGHKHLRCPSCDMKDQVILVDISVRENPSEVEWEAGSGFVLQVSQGDGDHQTDHYLCGNCRVRVDVPEGTDQVW